MIDDLINDLMIVEGGYVNNPDDLGGPTKYGITQETLADWRGHYVTAIDVRLLSEREAFNIYENVYWIEPKICDLGLSEVLEGMVFDAGVNHGVSRSIKFLQTALGLTADGVIGPNTIGAAQECNSVVLASRFMGERVEYYGSIITNNPSQAQFALGWARRCKTFINDIPEA